MVRICIVQLLFLGIFEDEEPVSPSVNEFIKRLLHPVVNRLRAAGKVARYVCRGRREVIHRKAGDRFPSKAIERACRAGSYDLDGLHAMTAYPVRYREVPGDTV